MIGSGPPVSPSGSAHVYVFIHLYYNPVLVYCRELAPSTVSLTGDWAQGDDSKHDSHYNPFIRNCVWKLKLKSISGASTLVKNSYETIVTHNEWNDATPLTNPLPASSFNSLHAEAWWHHSENPRKRSSQKETNQYICTRSAHFFCFPQLTFFR